MLQAKLVRPALETRRHPINDELRCTQIDYDSLAVGVMETRFHGNLRSVDDHLDDPLAPGP